MVLNATHSGPREPAKPGLHVGPWGRSLLDDAATVAEALALLEQVQVVMVGARGREATVRLAIGDAGGGSAIVECSDGNAVSHHGPQHRIMTHDPTHGETLALLAAQDVSTPSGDMPLPGNVDPRDRFPRAAHDGALLPAPRSQREAIAAILAIARNVSVPFGAPCRGFGIDDTESRTAIDLTDRRYVVELTTSPNVVGIDLMALDLSAGQPVRAVDSDDLALAGDVTATLAPIAAPFSAAGARPAAPRTTPAIVRAVTRCPTTRHRSLSRISADEPERAESAVDRGARSRAARRRAGDRHRRDRHKVRDRSAGAAAPPWCPIPSRRL